MASLPEHRSGRPYRVGDLLGMQVVGSRENVLGQVTDVRVSWETDATGESVMVVDGFVVGSGRSGSLLGYDRRQEQGPALLGAVVRWLHRRSVVVGWSDVRHVDWAERSVRLTTDHGERLRS